jgi:predicted nuclease of restriction endonuclease-like RecB superfamily
MFSKDLLVTRKRRPYITPVYLHPDELLLAARIISIYRKGKTKGEIDEETSSLETHSNFRVVRGLSELMRRRTTFSPLYAADPRAVRTFLYERGTVTNKEERSLALEEAALKFSVSVEDIESSFWADREEFHTVSEVEDIPANDLITYYNLSLTQTLLFDAISLQFSSSGNYQDIFRMIKYLGLMYEVDSEQDPFVVTVTGPASLFRKTKKYGTALAKLLPHIMRAPSWKIRAQVETRVAGEPRIYIFELSDSKQKSFPDTLEPIERFDSAVEENFLKRFSSLRKDWDIKREPTILQTGATVMIPDFSVERRGKKCYVEIVGFWTPEYLEKKTEKVRKLQEEIILCVSKELQCAKKDFQKENVNVVFYDKQVPMKPILDKIRCIEEEQLREEGEKVSEGQIELTGEIVSLEDIARSQNVGIEAVKRVLENSEEGEVVGDMFVKKSVLESLRMKVAALDDMRLPSVREVLKEYNLDEKVLKALGYDIEWKTLDMNQAVVKKAGSS